MKTKDLKAIIANARKANARALANVSAKNLGRGASIPRYEFILTDANGEWVNNVDEAVRVLGFQHCISATLWTRKKTSSKSWTVDSMVPIGNYCD